MEFDNEYKKCYIAFLDILGFKDKIENKTCKEILDIFNDIKNPLKKAYINEDGIWREIFSVQQVNFKCMSDSICMYIDATAPDALLCLISACSIFQAKLLKREDPVLVRGAIVLGDIYAKDDITFGTGMTKAYQLEENSAKYPRIIMTKETVLQGAKNASTPILMERLWKYVECDFDDYYVTLPLDTLLLLHPIEEGNDRCDKLMNHIYEVLNSSTNSSVREKYIYLKNKLERMRKQNNV